MNATFNPATFCTSTMTDAQFKRMEQRDDIDHSPRVDPMVARLLHAAGRFDARRDSFAQGKGDTCRDLAAKLQTFGSFVSEKQAAFAEKLVAWSLPREQAPAAPYPMSDSGYMKRYGVLPPAPVMLTALHDVMQRLSRMRFGKITIARQNGNSLCWVKVEGCDKVVGKIDNGVLTQWTRQGVDMAEVQVMLKVINLDPQAAAAKHGLESGNCSLCGRDLTDPVSLARGIGPVCIENAGW